MGDAFKKYDAIVKSERVDNGDEEMKETINQNNNSQKEKPSIKQI